MDLKDKVAVVTGGTGGLGWRICRTFADVGMKIVLVYLNSKEKAEQYVAELEKDGASAIAVGADVTTEEGMDTISEQAKQAYGGVDVLVLDAAYNIFIPFEDLETLDADQWNYILNFNLTAPYLAMRKIGAAMKERGQGRIITVSSVAGLKPSGSSIAYSVSKAALIQLTRCMSVSLAPQVLVNCVAPGLMEGTRMTENLTPEYAEMARNSVLLKRAADKDDVADAVLTLVRTDSITGQTLVVDAGGFFH
jgi:3-oxoacyl-[acyl-carrier protein] reductase